MRNTVIYVAAALVLLAGCRKQDERVSREQTGSGAGDVPVGFVIGNMPATKSGLLSESWTADSAFVVRHVPCPAEGDGMTKVDVTTTANLSSFYLNISKETGTETSVEENRLFSKGEGGQFTAGLYWPITDPKYHFYASNIEMMTGSDRSSVSCPADKDVVCAYLEEPTYFLVNTLEFSHVYARIGSVSVTPPAGYTATLKSAQLTCGVSGIYDIKTGKWPSIVSQSVTLSTSNDAWVVPGKYTLSAMFTLSDGKVSEDITCGGEITLQAGCVNNIEATSKAFFGRKLILTPASKSVYVRDTVKYNVTCETYYGTKKLDSRTVPVEDCSWQSSDAEKVTVSAGVAIAKGNGTATITVSYGDASATASVTVLNTLLSLVLTPQSVKVTKNTKVTYTAREYWSDGTYVDVTNNSATTYSSSDEYIAAHVSGDAKNVFTARGVHYGSSTIKVSYKNLTATATFTCAEITSIKISPTSASIAVGEKQAYKCYAYYSGSPKGFDVTDYATFGGGASTVATVSGNVATGVGVGTTSVTVTYGGLKPASSSLTVTAKKTLKSITVSPVSTTIMVGKSQAYTVTATYEAAGSTLQQTVTSSADYAITNPSGTTVATLGTGSSKNVATGVSAGTATITASYSYGGVTKTAAASLTVNHDRIPAHAVLNLSSKNLVPGGTATASMTVTYSDQSTKTVTTEGTYSVTSGTSYASVSGNTVTATAAGDATIKGSYTENGTTVSATANLHVYSVTYGLSVESSPSRSFDPDETVTFTAKFLTYYDGNVQKSLTKDVTGSSTWKSDAPAIIDLVNNKGTTHSYGDTYVSATYLSGGMQYTASKEVSVTRPVLSAIYITCTPSEVQNLPYISEHTEDAIMSVRVRYRNNQGQTLYTYVTADGASCFSFSKNSASTGEPTGRYVSTGSVNNPVLNTGPFSAAVEGESFILDVRYSNPKKFYGTLTGTATVKFLPN